MPKFDRDGYLKGLKLQDVRYLTFVAFGLTMDRIIIERGVTRTTAYRIPRLLKLAFGLTLLGVLVRSVNEGWLDLSKSPAVLNAADISEFERIMTALGTQPLTDTERRDLLASIALEHDPPLEAGALMLRLGITEPREGHLAMIVAAAAHHRRLHWTLPEFQPPETGTIIIKLPGDIFIEITGPAGQPVIGELNHTKVQVRIPGPPDDHAGPAD